MQLSLFPELPRYRESTLGSFVGNMDLPVHRWFRYSAPALAAHGLRSKRLAIEGTRVALSLDVRSRSHLWETTHRSYFVWEFGKPPDLVVEIVSNRKEVDAKRRRYARMGVGYYVIYDPWRAVMSDDLRVYRLSGGRESSTHSPDAPRRS